MEKGRNNESFSPKKKNGYADEFPQFGVLRSLCPVEKVCYVVIYIERGAEGKEKFPW